MTSNNYRYPRTLDYKGSVDSGFQEPIDLVSPNDSAMEINSHYSSIGRKDMPQSPLGSPVTERRPVPQAPLPMADQELQHEIASLKRQQEIQQQMLLQQFHAQQQQMVQEHEKQMQDHIKQLILMQKQQEYMEQQKKMEERQRLERELMEKERLEQIKHKKKDEESAIASSEVKQRLQEFVLTKKHREAAVRNSPPQFRQWVDQNSPPQGLSPPYGPALLKYDDDFPLRKTASEPNLKVRSALKQKVMERRITHSPILRRKDKSGLAFKRKTALSMDCGSNSDSGPNSPPNSTHPAMPNGSLTSLHKEQDAVTYPYLLYKTLGVYPDLYSSPSMPNISLGRPPSSSGSSNLSGVATEAELRAMNQARLGVPLGPHVVHGNVQFYPSLPVIDGEFSPPTNSAYITAQMKAIEEQRNNTKIGTSPLANPYPVPPHGSAAVSEGHHARIHKHRPLGRTQSAPLPLGNPYLQPQNLILQQQQQQQQPPSEEQILRDRLYIKHHIRQAVLQRTSSKTHMENVDEESEAKISQEMKESREQTENIAVAAKENKMEEFIGDKQPHEPETFPAHPHREVMKPKPRGPHHRPLARTQSSPLVTFSMPPQPQDTGPVRYRFTTGLAYDTIMHKHQCTCGDNSNHPEHAGRLQSIWSRLQERGLVCRSERVKCRKATREEIQSCHTEMHSLLYGTNPFSRQKLDPQIFENLPMKFVLLNCGGLGVDSDTVWNELHTPTAAKMATGCVIELAFKVAAGELKNGMAVVRPPGHHAEEQQAMGFCFFNSIAIAAKQLREKLKTEKILIVDWDVHHGNGTQQMFYQDNHVLYISIHRHDNGNFFPGTGAPEECGEEDGLGFNVNIAFSGNLNPPMGDAEYLTAFRTIIMPIARDFNPDVVLVSAGFDAAIGHPPPLGGYEVSAACFSHMTKELMSLAGGKVVLTLEGGYQLTSICDAAEMCVSALLGDELPALSEEELCRTSCKAAQETFASTINLQARHWPCIQKYLGTIHYSLIEAQKREVEEADTVSALASLSMVTGKRSGSVEQESEPMEEGS